MQCVSLFAHLSPSEFHRGLGKMLGRKRALGFRAQGFIVQGFRVYGFRVQGFGV